MEKKINHYPPEFHRINGVFNLANRGSHERFGLLAGNQSFTYYSSPERYLDREARENAYEQGRHRPGKLILP